MPLSVDELLAPRIKRINKWPGMPHNCPELLKISGDRFYFPFDLDMELGYPLSSLPEWSHLVKPLEWHEDRKPEDLPEYVKWKEGAMKTGDLSVLTICGKVVSIDYDRKGDPYFNIEKEGQMPAAKVKPATLEEYLAYTNSLTTKQD